MKRIMLLSSLLLLFLQGRSQSIVDFNLMDSDNNSHTLYTNLNAGKTTLLWFFSHNDNNSQNSASMIEGIYQDFGQNNGNYIVLGMDVILGPASDVNTFKSDNSVTLPCIGGGSGPPSGNDYLTQQYWLVNWQNTHFQGSNSMPQVAVICAAGGAPWDANDLMVLQTGLSVVEQDLRNGMYCWPEAVEMLQHKDGVLLYPNPASGTITLLTRQPKAIVYVYNTLGKKVLSDTFSNQGMNRIDVSSLQSGCYTVEVRSEGGLVRLPLNVVN